MRSVALSGQISRPGGGSSGHELGQRHDRSRLRALPALKFLCKRRSKGVYIYIAGNCGGKPKEFNTLVTGRERFYAIASQQVIVAPCGRTFAPFPPMRVLIIPGPG